MAVILWVVLFLTEDKAEGKIALFSTSCKYLENDFFTQAIRSKVRFLYELRGLLYRMT